MPVRVKVTTTTCKVSPETGQLTECGIAVKDANHITTFLMLTSCKACKAAAKLRAESESK